MVINIEKKTYVPVYRQIIDQVIDQVKNGNIGVMDKLPTERELSIETGLSRGTIMRAYDELADQGIIKRIQGRGTFVAPNPNKSRLNKSENLLQETTELIENLRTLSLTYKDIEMLIYSKIKHRRESGRKIQIALVDCNEETLSVMGRQLKNVPEMDVQEFVLDELVAAPQKLHANFDMIFTTPTHFSQVLHLAPSLSTQIKKIIIIPSHESQYNLTKIKDNAMAGIWGVSSQYAAMIRDDIEKTGRSNVTIDILLDNDKQPLSRFVLDKDVLVVPKSYTEFSSTREKNTIDYFKRNNGFLIEFEYRIDSGSLIYIIDTVEQCKTNKKMIAKNADVFFKKL